MRRDATRPAESSHFIRHQMKVRLKRWHGISVWKWEVPGEEVCGICRMPYESCCPGLYLISVLRRRILLIYHLISTPLLQVSSTQEMIVLLSGVGANH